METIIIVSHEVQRFETWQEAFYARAHIRHEAGILTLGVYRDLENENYITVVSEAPSPEVAAAFIDNPELKALWKEIGIIGEPSTRIMKKVS